MLKNSCINEKDIQNSGSFDFLAALTSCDKKDLEIDDCPTDQSKVVTQELNITTFDRIRINGDFDVQILQTESQKVYITLEPNLIDKLNKSVINKEWKLEFVNCDNKKNTYQ